MAGGSKSKAAAPKDDPNVTYEHGSLVLAKISGYSPWPGCVVEKPHIPDAVIKSQPKGKPFVIRYLPTADYAFAKKSDLVPLDNATIDKFLAGSSKSKTKTANSLYSAYEQCKNHKSWLKETDENVRQANLAAEDEDELEEDEEAAPAPKKKAAKKEKEPKTSDGKKRKREDGDAKANGQTKGDGKKSEKKSKDSTASAKKQKTDKPASSSKAAAGDDDDDGESLDPEAIKVKNWRHKLQRAFLGKDGTLKAEDMEANDAVFKTVEGYSMTVEQLRLSKIGKVMKRIVTLPGTIPRDEEFHFRKRAEALVNKWSNVLSSNGGDESKVGDLSMAQEAPSQDKAPSPKNDTAAVNDSAAGSNGTGEEKSQEAPATSSSAAEPKQDE